MKKLHFEYRTSLIRNKVFRSISPILLNIAKFDLDAYLSRGGDELGALLYQGEVHLSDQFHVGDDLRVAKVDEPDSHLLNLPIFSPLDPVAYRTTIKKTTALSFISDS